MVLWTAIATHEKLKHKKLNLRNIAFWDNTLGRVFIGHLRFSIILKS